MKQTILRFGLYAAAVQLTFFITIWFIIGASTSNIDLQEVFGYASIILSLSFIFFGVRYYRDQVNNGRLTFLQGLKVGVLIALIPAVSFALTDTIWAAINPEICAMYSQHQLDELRKTTPATEFAAKAQALKEQTELFTNPVIGFMVMFITVLLIGFVISLISALVLKRTSRQ